jgi:hypothetical protein
MANKTDETTDEMQARCAEAVRQPTVDQVAARKNSANPPKLDTRMTRGSADQGRGSARRR